MSRDENAERGEGDAVPGGADVRSGATAGAVPNNAAGASGTSEDAPAGQPEPPKAPASKPRRRNAGRIAACAVAVVVVMSLLLVFLSALFQPKDNTREAGMNDPTANGVLGEPENSIDVLFIGDSEAYSTFSPMQMWEEHGFTSYVCGTPGQQLPYSNVLLRRATRGQRPRVVVIEADAVFAPFSPGDAALKTAQGILPVVEYHDRWKSLTPADFAFNVKATWTDDLKGFRIEKEVAPAPADAADHMAPTDDVEPIPAMNRMFLKVILDYCESIGAQVMLVSTPSAMFWDTAHHNGIEAYAREAGLQYIDLNMGDSKIPIDWQTETHDHGYHVNLVGAKKVSSFMGGHLAATYDLPDHRQDAAYSAWHEAAKRYDAQM